MSHQLALSSLFSILALASLSLAAASGMLGQEAGSLLVTQPYSVQAEIAPALNA